MFSSAPIITDVGKTLLLRAAGGEKITFTKFQAGNGLLSEGETPETATALKNAVLTNISITKAEDTEDDGYLKLTGSFDNQTHVQADFRWTELGLIAKDENDVEYLYAYGYDEEYAEIIRAGGAEVLTEQTISVIIAIGDTSNITAYVIPNATYAGKAEFDAHVADKNNPHGVTKEQIGAAAASHNHSASDINSGILPVSRGGTGVGSIEELSNLLSTNFVFGTFVGDGKSRHDIILGFTPKKVFIILVNVGGENNQVYNAAYIEPQKNLYHSGCGSAYYSQSAETMLARGHGGAGVITNGFAVGSGSGGRTDQNMNGRTYVYFAFK